LPSISARRARAVDAPHRPAWHIRQEPCLPPPVGRGQRRKAVRARSAVPCRTLPASRG